MSKYSELMSMANAAAGGGNASASKQPEQKVNNVRGTQSTPASSAQKPRTIEETMELLGVGQKKDRYSFKAEQEERRAQQSMRQTVPETKKAAGKKPADWLGTLKYGARRGITAADNSVAKGVDWLVGGVADELHALGQSTLQSLGIDSDYFNGKDTLLDKYIAEGERRMEAQGRLRDEAAGDSKAAQKVGQYTEMVANSLPMSVMALLSGGTAAAPQASTAALKAASSIANSGKAWQAVKPIADAAVSMLKNPNWGFTFASTVGSSYDDAIADGASEDAASMYAILNAAFNATTEIGGTDDVLGGLQKLPVQLRKALEAGDKNLALRIIKNMSSEIGEEIVQGIGERGLKSLYKDVPLVSTTDENAMFNPRSALEEAEGAAVVSAVLGGGQAAVQTAANAAANQVARRQTARTATPVQENIPAADAADVMEQTAPVQSSAETGAEKAKPGARERAKIKRRREQRAKFQAETEFWDKQAQYRMDHGYDAALPKELESTNFSNWVKKRTKAILKEGGGDYTVLPPWESDSGFEEASSPDSVNEGNVARHADAATPGKTFNAVDALADYGKPAETAQARTETQGDNPAPAKAEIVKQAGSDVLNSVLNLNSKNAQPKMTTEQIYNEYFAPKTQPSSTQTTAERRAALDERLARLMKRIEAEGENPDVQAELSAEADAIDAEDRAIKASEEQQRRVSAGEVSKSFGSPDNHIDNRSFADAANRRTKAFQFDYPELHDYFVEAAQSLMDDVQAAQDADYIQRYKKGGTAYHGPINRLIDSGMTKPRIIQCLTDIINNNGAENYADAKRVEIVLNDMLSNGWLDMARKSHAANADYISAKDGIVGAVKADSWEKYRADHELSLVTGLATEEELRAEWEAGQPKPTDNGTKTQKNTASTQETEKTRLNMADYADNNSGVWNNLSYDDTAAQTKAMQDAHKRMMSEGRVVNIPESTLQKTAESFPDLRGMKKSERTPILKQKMTELKTDIRKFLNGLKNGSFEFEINGNILEAKLYDTGIKEVMEKVTQDKANMLSHSDQVFNNAEYLYSLPDYEGNPNVYRWNYFYTPVQIGDTTVGVRIAIRDMKQTESGRTESQIYNWGIKKAPTLNGGSPEKTSLSADVSSVGEIDASLDGARRLPSDGSIPGGVSSEALEASASTTSIPTRAQNVKGENAGNAEGGQGRTRNGQYVLEDYESSPKEKERGFSRNVRTDNAMDATIRESFDATPETYEQLANKDTLTKAKDIFSKGISEARSEVEQALGAAKNGSKLAPEMVPLARMVANELSKTGDVETARRILADVATELTAAGQLGQAGRILRNTDSNTALASIQKSIDAINTEFAKQHKNSKWKAELTAAETEKILSTDFTEKGAYERIYDEIATRLGKEMPSSVLEKLTEIRRINMLLRPRTQIKNIASNVPMIGLRKGAETLSIGIQSVLTKTGFMDKTDRTRGWASREQRQLAKDYYEANKADINGQSNKWDLKSALREKRTIFKGGAIEKAVSKMTGKEIDSFGEALRQVTYNCLKAGDAPFVKSAFVDSLAQYCAAKGITSSDGITREAIDFATANAMEATFKNANVIADIVNQAKRNSSPGVSAAIDVLIPFTTTPANILSLMGDYSPVGFGKMIAKDGPAAKIDAFSKASVGTAMLALGFALRNAGIITGGEDDDKDKAALDKATGQGTYSFPLSIGGSVSYDWAQPVGSLMAFGAEIADAVKGQESWDSAVMNAIYTAGDATLNLSLFQNIISVLRGSGKPTQQIIDAIMEGGATQLVPGLAGDIAKIIDGTVRSTYTGGNVFDDIGAKVLSTTPGFSKKLPASVNVRGEENTRGGLAARAANTLLNPTNYTGGKRNAVDEEIYRLYDATGSTVFFPSVSPYKIEYGNETYTMNGKDRETFQKVQGQTYYDLANPLLSSEMYKALSDEQKASVLKSIRDYALDAAKRQFVDGQGGEYSNSQWDPIAELTKGQISAYIPAKQALKDGADGKGGKKAYDAVDLLLDNYGKLPKTVQARLEGEDLNVNKLLYADALGIGSKDYYAASKAVSDGKAKLGTSDVAKAISVYNNMKGKSDGEILSAIKAQVPPAKGGKQSSTVRRIEAYSKLAGDDADLGKWLELCASLSDADENSSVTKADVYTAWANMGLGPKDKYAGIDRNGFYNIVKSSKSLASNPDYATQIDEVYALLVPAEEKTKPKLTGTVQGGATGSKSVQHWSYEDIMESLGLAAKK